VFPTFTLAVFHHRYVVVIVLSPTSDGNLV